MCVYLCERVSVSECVCMCVCVCVYVGGWLCMIVCMCTCGCVCVYGGVWLCVVVCGYAWKITRSRSNVCGCVQWNSHSLTLTLCVNAYVVSL